MPDVFLTSDTHFGHGNIIEYCNRPFRSITEMNDQLIANWNTVVRPEDKVYHLGDVTINSKWLHLIGQCNGNKVLIKGNHDVASLSAYAEYFRDVRAIHVLADCVLTHVPIHPFQLGRFKANVHGHLHDEIVRVAKYDDPFSDVLVPDTRYINVCVEHTKYSPIPLDEVLSWLKK